MTRSVYLHIGYPKTATTFLQRRVFPALEGVRYLGRIDGHDNTCDIDFLDGLLNAVSFSTERSFESQLVTLRELLSSGETQLFGNSSAEEPVLISDEALLFRTLLPLEIPWLGQKQVACIKRLFVRLKAFFDNIDANLKIIVSLRSQADLIHSLYSEKNYYFKRFEDTNTLEKYLASALGKDYANYGLCNLEYHQVVDSLRKLFGSGSLLVLKHEELTDTPVSYYKQLTDFTNSNSCAKEFLKSAEFSENKRATAANQKTANQRTDATNDGLLKVMGDIKRVFIGNRNNTFTRRVAQKVISLRPKTHTVITLSTAQRSLINNHFSESNKKLAKLDERFAAYIDHQPVVSP